MFEDYDSILIECEEDVEINETTLVCVSPYDSKNDNWLGGFNEIMPLIEAIKLKKTIVLNNKVLAEFIKLHRLYSRNKLSKSNMMNSIKV